MKFRYSFLFLILVLLLSACGAAAPEAAVLPAEDVNLADLPLNIDAETLNEIKDNENVFVLDVREDSEFYEAHIPGITHIPMGEISSRLDEIPADKTIVVTCRSGNRSSQVTQYLLEHGFDDVHNLDGGLIDWQGDDLPVESCPC